MKTNATILLILIFCQSFAQPNKGSVYLGGDGYFSKIHSENELKLRVYELNVESGYFVLKHLSLGALLHLQGGKMYYLSNDPKFHRFYIAPALEAFALNQKQFSLSLKGTANFRLSKNVEHFDKLISSFLIGPKVGWNITENFSTYLWFAYKQLDDIDNFSGFRSEVPSKNFDIKWGFTYYLNRKNEE